MLRHAGGRDKVARAMGGSVPGMEFLSLTDGAHEALYRFQILPDRRTLYVNPAIAAITGHQPDEFYRNPFLNVTAVHPEDRHLAEQPYRSEGGPMIERAVLR